MISEAFTAESEAAIPAEEVRAALERIARSDAFRRAPRSTKFLSYVCEVTLRGDADSINEYLIGSEVFERGDDYSPSEDAVVRRHAHNLRLKLDSYYANEGREEAVRIELPVGHYVPVFRRQSAALPEAPAGAAATAPERSRGLSAPLVAAIAAIALVAGWFLRSTAVQTPAPNSQELPEEVREIWGPWLDDSRGATICFANSAVAVVHHVPDPELEDDHPEHFRPSEAAAAAFRREFGVQQGGYFYFRPSKVKTSIAESISAVVLARFFGKTGVPVRGTQSRLIGWDDLRRENFIVLGHNEANPWVDLLLKDQPLVLGDSRGVRRYIVNRSPAEGEAPQYHKEIRDSLGQEVAEFALISMLPGVGDANWLLLITGLDGQATQMAAEYLTDSRFLAKISRRLSAAGAGEGPKYFQAVLEVIVRDRVPTRGNIVALRRVEPAAGRGKID